MATRVRSRFTKDPQARLDYAFDWSAGWLAAGETISSQTVVSSGNGVTVDGSPGQASGIVTVWLTGGTVGTSAHVTCHITTSAGRQDDRTITIDVRER